MDQPSPVDHRDAEDSEEEASSGLDPTPLQTVEVLQEEAVSGGGGQT